MNSKQNASQSISLRREDMEKQYAHTFRDQTFTVTGDDKWMNTRFIRCRFIKAGQEPAHFKDCYFDRCKMVIDGVEYRMEDLPRLLPDSTPQA